MAVELGKISVIDKLFALGVDGNVCDLNGKTASMAAAELGFVDILDKLISYGCDLAQQEQNTKYKSKKKLIFKNFYS